MATKIFVNLPVNDLSKSMAFFRHLGYGFNAQFTNDVAACMVISEDIYAMLLTKPFFQTFIPNPISNAHEQTEVLVCLSCNSRQEVDDMVNKAREAGGTIFRDPQDHGFMYAHAYRDLDGHIWEVMYMDPAVIQPTT